MTKTGKACKGSGGKVAQFLSNLPPASGGKIPDTKLSEADPLDPGGDTLYAIYRKGLITRHITKNGRILPEVALEKINFDPDSYDGSGFINVVHSDGTIVKIPIGNVRYSEERIPDNDSPEKIMWAPVVAPTKYPGYDNNGYYVISGNDDNALYYGGGLALALFSLESINSVSIHSIHYARRIFLYFLASEMWEGNGFIIRKPGFFNSNRNRNGESIIQGASLEELLGFFLGILYYLKAENPAHPLYSEAVRLRDNVLTKISKGNMFSKYKHPFMISSEDESSYLVKICFEFAYFAVREYRPGRLDLIEQRFISGLTLGSGRTRPADGAPFWPVVFFPDPVSFILYKYLIYPKIEEYASYELYMMFLTSMLLVLDGNIPENKKEWFAKVFMRDVIKASKTSGPDIDRLRNNLYMSAVGLLVNKYLNEQRDSWRNSQQLSDIWGDKIGIWNNMKSHPSPFPQFNSLKEIVPTPIGEQWQHNLPLMKREDGSFWIDHNPYNGIGRQFVWKYSSNSYIWGYDLVDNRVDVSENEWLKDFPGWEDMNHINSSILDPNGHADEHTYKTRLFKGYSNKNYLQQEIALGTRRSEDNQVEGAGLGLLFLRMLLTHINPERYPKPDLPDKYDKLFPVLPYVGAEPMSLQLLHNAYRYQSTSDCTSFEIHGDQDESLRIVKLGDEYSPSKDFIVAYAGEDEKLVLKHGFLSNGATLGFEMGIYLDSEGKTWKRFDKAILASTVNDKGDNVLIVAERAEGERTKNPTSFCFLRRKHWLRLSTWKVPSFADGQNPNPVLIDKWVTEDRHCNAVKELDMTLLDQNHVAVIYRTRNDADRIRIFEITNTIRSVCNEQITDEIYDNRIKIAAAFGNIIIFSRQHSSGWRLASREWDGNNLVPKSITSIQYGELLDMTTVRSGERQYLVVVTKQDGYLRVYSYEILDGSLTIRGEFHTIDGERFLVGREADYERASVSSLDYDDKAGFVIVGKGVAREIKDEDGNWKKTRKGLKIVYGHILEDGRPTVVTSNVLGSGESSAMRMLDVTGHMTDGTFHGVISAHKTKKYDCFLGMWCESYLNLTFWQYRDPYKDQRWNNYSATVTKDWLLFSSTASW